MRILFVSQIIPYPPHGGVLQRGFNLLREIGRHHEVHLLAFHHPDELSSAEAIDESRRRLGEFCSHVEYFDLWPKQSSAKKLGALLAGSVARAPFSVIAHRSRILESRIESLCGSPQHPQLVHLDTIGLFEYRVRCNGLPVVLGHHNIESQLMRRRADYEAGALARWYIRRQARLIEDLERSATPTVDMNVVVSDADASTLRSLAPNALCTVIPNGVDIDYFVDQRDGNSLDVIFTGGMNMFANRDGVEWFLSDIWPLIKAAVPGARFFAIGQRPSAKVLEIAKNDHSVQAPGFVDDIRPAVARAAVYVVPLRVGGGTRLKVVDAMAQGKAIVSTSLGAEGIQAENHTHLELADTVESFARTVVLLLNDKSRRSQLGMAAREKAVESYSWGRLGLRLSSTYEEVVRKKGRSC